ncbi:hypothetical protein L226DRAFT_576745 [Lentinus tigrinus ALCF2SS1-7]|uniref:Uncharacterized protein n=1 Tax=Lentinus tigrinus ALCF2SS1-6 TaxID=1328759 RepID=A0A5C2RNL5_9APHY|nr:hypothetical protein L227DRAFT_617604 [Lentinus tigrinus ALCF2SS1-6]RPD68049.1 hypothetical protein L226DRAFT_576745 [Lentinus tigrinus ALCF2SS1-7]
MDLAIQSPPRACIRRRTTPTGTALHSLHRPLSFLHALLVLPTRPDPHLPIRALAVDQFSDLHLAYFLTHARDHVLFPLLQGLEGDDEQQNTFRVSAYTPTFFASEVSGSHSFDVAVQLNPTVEAPWSIPPEPSEKIPVPANPSPSLYDADRHAVEARLEKDIGAPIAISRPRGELAQVSRNPPVLESNDNELGDIPLGSEADAGLETGVQHP